MDKFKVLILLAILIDSMQVMAQEEAVTKGVEWLKRYSEYFGFLGR
jgi:hypothetical protein